MCLHYTFLNFLNTREPDKSCVVNHVVHFGFLIWKMLVDIVSSWLLTLFWTLYNILFYVMSIVKALQIDNPEKTLLFECKSAKNNDEILTLLSTLKMFFITLEAIIQNIQNYWNFQGKYLWQSSVIVTPLSLQFAVVLLMLLKLMILWNFIMISWTLDYVKSVRIRRFYSSYFPPFRLNTERYSVFNPIANTDTYHTVQCNSEYGHFSNSVGLWFWSLFNFPQNLLH